MLFGFIADFIVTEDPYDRNGKKNYRVIHKSNSFVT